MTINHEQLAAVQLSGREAEDVVRRIEPRELELYRAEIDEWIGLGWPGTDFQKPIEDIILYPSGKTSTIPAFFRWMRDNHRGPWAPPPERPFRVGDRVRYTNPVNSGDQYNGTILEEVAERIVEVRQDDGPRHRTLTDYLVHLNPAPEVVTVAGRFHVGDTVRYRDSAGLLAGGSRTVAGPGHNGGVRFTNGNWSQPRHLELVSCPHGQQPEGTPTAPASEQPAPEPDHGDVDLTTIGPNHPGWPAFLAVAKRIADEAGYCGEYEHIVARLTEELTAPEYEEVTIEATVRATVTVRRGDDPDPVDVITPPYSSLDVRDWRYTDRRPVRN